MTRAYSADQIAALLFACEQRYQSADWNDAGMWLEACHKIKDRLAFVRFMEAM